MKERLRRSITDQDDLRASKAGSRAALAALDADERAFGFQLPRLLKRLYSEVGNGGFGPGYGLLGLTGGVPDDQNHNALELYALYRGSDREDPLWQWPAALLPICHWGCAIYSCIDCTSAAFAVKIFDPNGHEDGESWNDAFFPECESFEHWIELWASGANLWDRMYGDDGHIARIYKDREEQRGG